MALFSISINVGIPTNQVEQTKEFITNGLKQFELETEFTETKVDVTNLEVKVSANTNKIVKNLLKKLGSAEEEINALSKVKSVVESAIAQATQFVMQQVTQRK